MRIIVAVTGASAVELGFRLIRALNDHELFCIVTDAAWRLAEIEMGGRPDLGSLRVYGERDFEAPLCSSSFACDAMAVVPCSMKTLAGIAHGHADTLVVRAADSMLRMGKKLVVAPRETPLSLSGIENMAAVKRGGAVVLPPILAMYPAPQSISELLDFFVGKIMDCLGVPNSLYKRWGE